MELTLPRKSGMTTRARPRIIAARSWLCSLTILRRRKKNLIYSAVAGSRITDDGLTNMKRLRVAELRARFCCTRMSLPDIHGASCGLRMDRGDSTLRAPLATRLLISRFDPG